jgi:tRNA(Leu) C34 or U34 (ribose-2'-O)-methylase TrmL
MRGFYGIGSYRPKNSTNLGMLWRSAHQFDAAFMATIGTRCGFEGQPSNTTRAERHLPLYIYPTIKDLILPENCRIVCVEQTSTSVPLEDFQHPAQAFYLLGAEDDGIPPEVLEYARGGVVHISTKRCLNVAVAGSIVMYDRFVKASRPRNLSFHKDAFTMRPGEVGSLGVISVPQDDDYEPPVDWKKE